MPDTIQCTCGRVLVWADDVAVALCPNCGQSFSKAVATEATDAAESPAPSAEFDFRDPDDHARTRRKAETLYSPLAIGIAGLVGTVLAGSILLGLNLYALRRKTTAVLVMLTGFVGSAVILTLLPGYLDLPIGAGAIAPLALVFGIQMAAGGIVCFSVSWLLTGSAADHASHRWLPVPLVSLACVLPMFGLQVVWTYPFAWGGVPPTRSVYYGGGQRLVYSVEIPRATVTKAANVLFRNGVFREHDPQRVDVFFIQRDDHVEVRFFVDENAWRADGAGRQRLFDGGFDPPPNPGLEDFFRGVRQELADGPFRDKKVCIVICNTLGKQMTVLSWPAP